MVSGISPNHARAMRFYFRCAAIPSAVACRAEVASNALEYPKFYSRSHDAVLRVYDTAGNVIETHDYKGEFKEW
jgi:hypothetical protein